MKSTNTRSKIILVSVVLIVLVLGYAYMYWDFIKTNNGISLLSVDIANNVSQEERVVRLRQTVSSIKSDQSLLDSLFVDNEKVASFIQTVESLADTAGLSHTLTIDLQPDTSLLSYNKEFLQFHMVTGGNWRNTLRFMELLENMPYKLYVGSVELSQNTDTKKGASWDGNFDFTVIKNK